MDEYRIIILRSNTEEFDKYLSDAIYNYGINQLKGERPVKIYCCSKDKEGNNIGGVMGYVTRNLLFITHLFVEQKYRNNGIGKALLLNIENAAKEQGCSMLRLNTLNDATYSLYIKAGFEITTIINDYMNGFNLMYYHKAIK